MEAVGASSWFLQPYYLTATDASQWGETACVHPFLTRLRMRRLVLRSLFGRSSYRQVALGNGCMAGSTLNVNCPRMKNPTFRIHSGRSLPRCRSTSFFMLDKRYPRHINVGELRGMLRAEKLLGPRERSRREIYALDSQVALGTIIQRRRLGSTLTLSASTLRLPGTGVTSRSLTPGGSSSV